MAEPDEPIIVYHGSREIVTQPEIREARFHKDFYFGFYCTRFEAQAKRWATRFGKKGFVNEYEFRPCGSLLVNRFGQMTEEWLDFIVACRLGTPHGFDIVEGPMADDTIFNYVQNFIDGKISREAFWALAKFKRPTNQISFNTERSLCALSFVKSLEVLGEER